MKQRCAMTHPGTKSPTPNCQSKDGTRRTTRRLSRIAKGRSTRCSKRALARIAKGAGLIQRIRAEFTNLSTEIPQSTTKPGIAERAIDAAADVSHTIGEVAGGVRAAVDRMTSVIDEARKPGKSLSTVAAITREAPLASLFVAFLLGVAVARRR
jgi:hypothetical protein